MCTKCKAKNRSRRGRSRVSGFDVNSINWQAKATKAAGLAVGGIATQAANKVLIGALEKQLGTGQKVQQVANAITGLGGLMIEDLIPGSEIAKAAGEGMAAVSMTNLAISFLPADVRGRLGLSGIGNMSVLDLPLAEESISGYELGANVAGYGSQGGNPAIMGATNM